MSTITHAPGIEVDYSHIENAVGSLKWQYARSVRERRKKRRMYRASLEHWDFQEWLRFRRESWAYRDALRLLCPRRAAVTFNTNTMNEPNMQPSEHTPDPWRFEPHIETEGRLHTIWAGGVLIARTCFAPNSEANAKLLASAPTLLRENEELRAKLHHANSFLNGCNKHREWAGLECIGCIEASRDSLKAEVEKLTAEKNRITSICDADRVKIENLEEALDNSRALVEELEKDRERLDWLEKHGDHLYGQNHLDSEGDEDGWSVGAATDGSTIVNLYGKGPTLRAAIDAATKGAGE